ncbi:MAG: MgtC/SapB family protein [Candidatus Omnitrophica bacterium]|nr:MgtC/SapB family protein [Candidatus Omnitrophota bacterium]
MIEQIVQDLVADGGKFILAILCASLVGWERERLDKAAGLRTHILICVGACLFTVVGTKYITPVNQGELLRVFQGIITGVGFVGAGAIIRQGGFVRGLTTAAGVWVIAAIGLAIGAGEYTLALFCTVLMFFIMHFVGHLPARIKRKDD